MHAVVNPGSLSECGRCRSAICVCPDPRIVNCIDLVEFVSTAPDPDSYGYGTSPYLGDTGQTGVPVPALATGDQSRRYFIRLAGVSVASERAIRLVSLRQMIELRGETEDGSVAKLQVTSSFWHFTDANISWHLRWETNRYSRRHDRTGQQPGTSPDFLGLNAALLYRINAPDNYTPIGAGLPPGAPIDSLGTFHEIRFPWDNSQPRISNVLYGPGRLVFYASVRQTNPSDRPSVAAGALAPEDQFVLAFPDTARYGRVAGAITVELFPKCPPKTGCRRPR